MTDENEAVVNNGMHDAAWFYYKQGFNVIPIYAKKKIPCVKWEKYQDERIQEDEFKNWVDHGLFDDGIALVCGYNGLHAIDVDDKSLVDKLKIDLKSFAEKRYWVEETKRGYHIIARTLKTVPKYTHNGGIDYLGSKRLCIVTPSPDKKLIGVNSVPELPDLIIDDDLYSKYEKLIKNNNGHEPTKTIFDIKDGVSEGDRNNSAFKLACHHRDRGKNQDVTRTLLKEWNTKNTIPLPEMELEATIKSAFRYTQKTNIVFYTNPPKSLNELHSIISKWLHIIDPNRIDVQLATAISVYSDETPLWIFLVGRSGMTKTELINAMSELPYVKIINEVTPKTFVSGKKAASDLGQRLNHNYHLLIFKDLAGLLTINKDEKRAIWGQLRTLFDGDLYKMTGDGVDKAYESCRCNIFACVTSAIKEEYSIHQQLGTRELLYELPIDEDKDEQQTRKALENLPLQKQMRREIKEAMQGFLQTREYKKDIEIPQEIIDFLIEQCDILKIMRATAPIDWRTGELMGFAEMELPTRLIQQFAVLYKSLRSLDDDYPDCKFKEIIQRIVKSSGHAVRHILYYMLQKQTDHWFSLKELEKKTRLAPLTIKAQLEILRNLDIVEKEVREERIGWYLDTIYSASSGKDVEIQKGGRVIDVPYYRWKIEK